MLIRVLSTCLSKIKYGFSHCEISIIILYVHWLLFFLLNVIEEAIQEKLRTGIYSYKYIVFQQRKGFVLRRMNWFSVLLDMLFLIAQYNHSGWKVIALKYM